MGERCPEGETAEFICRMLQTKNEKVTKQIAIGAKKIFG